MCLGAIYWTRFPASISVDWPPTRLKQDLTTRLYIAKSPRRMLSAAIPMIQMMREEALAAFRAWQEKPDKIPLLNDRPVCGEAGVANLFSRGKTIARSLFQAH